MSESLVFSPRLYYLQISNPKSKGGDASALFANEELLPMIQHDEEVAKNKKKTNERQGVRN